MDFAGRLRRTAPGFQRTAPTIRLAGTIDDGIGFGDATAFLLELAPVTQKRLASRTQVTIGLGLPGEVRANHKARFCRRDLSHIRHVRRNVLLLKRNQPSSARLEPYAVSSNQLPGPYLKTLLNSSRSMVRVEATSKLRLAGVPSTVHDDAGLGIDQIVGRVGVKRRSAAVCMSIGRHGSVCDTFIGALPPSGTERSSELRYSTHCVAADRPSHRHHLRDVFADWRRP